MVPAEDPRTFGPTRLSFADTADIDSFVAMLGKFERGEITPDEWRVFRLVRGTYGQRQDGVQMMRVKAPQGIVSSPSGLLKLTSQSISEKLRAIVSTFSGLASTA